MTPAELEASESETVTVPFAGIDLILPASMEDLDGDVIDAIDDQKLSHALQGMLGAEQWAAFKRTKPKLRQYGELFDRWAKAVGLESLGE